MMIMLYRSSGYSVDYQASCIHDADMGVALKLYDELRHASSDEERAHLIADAFERFEERYPNLQKAVTSAEARETELRLQKEIEDVRMEIKDVELCLTRAIHRQTLWVIGSIGTILAIMRFLDSVAH